MTDSSKPDRSALVAYASMFIAALSLTASFYQLYIYTKQIDVIQRNVSRAEYIRACRDIIETYFQIKLKVDLIARTNSSLQEQAGERDGRQLYELEAANAVSRFAALGTYLANFQDDSARRQYTQLSHELSKAVTGVRATPSGSVDKLFEPADRLFAAMNDDCVRRAQVVAM